VLNVSADRRPKGVDGRQVVAAERWLGHFERRIILGEELDMGGLEASYDAGVPRIWIWVAEPARPRRIPVQR
jgi:HSP20 family protein